ncbi:ribonuclease Z [Sporolactobacillus vineae]|uniref:ribonuclease Z n=1 Tax=Sporolactobacillus vineae TaxID=444463 RepID=UPI0002887D6F|nr:ribonuclease Z [Sporolactobacillus vineae]
MDFTFLGTGAGIPAKERNVTSVAVGFPEYDGDLWLFDCGEGTQRQILYTPVKLTRLSVIFITHLHGDHLFGLPGILGTRSFQGAQSPLTLIGPRGLKNYIRTSLSVSGTHLHYLLVIREIEGTGVIYENDRFRVSTDRLDHGIASFGYRIEEHKLSGELLVDKLEAAGVKPGPVYGLFKKQPEVELPDGRVLRSADYLGKEKSGRVVTILGDTRPCSTTAKLSENADLLIHEATFRDSDASLAESYHHSTSVQAAETAKNASVHRLILTHLSSRYQKKDQKLLLAEAKKIFPHTILANDFKVYQLMRQKHRE